jgi:uridine phosphorylase
MDNHTRLLHTTLCREDAGQYAFLPGSPQRVDRIAKYLDNPVFVAENRELRTFAGTLEGQRVLVTSTGMGGPSAVIALEELTRLGVTDFIRIGTCSTTMPEVVRGDIVIPSAAVRMEGTSMHYAPLEYPAVPDFSLLCALKAASEKNGFPTHVGVIISRDSFYTQNEAAGKPIGYELQNRWNAYKQMGAIATEMECASLVIAASSLKVRAAGVMVDATDYNQYDEDHNHYPLDYEARAIETAVEAMRGIIRARSRQAEGAGQ